MTTRISKKITVANPDDISAKRYYVGIGASAGGLEAISIFFKNMPAKTGLTFIVIQHLSPDYKSMMDELLSKVTEIPVEVVHDGTEPLPDHIYLIPPRQNMTIFHGQLLLEAQDRSLSLLNLPIDLFLISLAEDQGINSVGIILSGTGSDGTRGCRVIKEAGGLVMAQSESSAKFPGMPKNVIANGLADYILSAEDLPEQLLKFVQHPLSIQKPEVEVLLDKSAMSKIFSMLRSKTKIDFTFYKPPTITRRLERRISIAQVASLDEYVDYLQGHPAEVTALYREFLIGVTNFYRDSEVFDLLRNEYILNYMRNLDSQEMRLWIAGCSTGEEAYTYAMLVQEISILLNKSFNFKIFATDIDQDSLKKASQGTYPESIAADLPQELINKYLIRKDDHYQVSRQLREMVVFARHDLIKDPPFTNIDLVSCRNLLIYLQPVLQRRIFDGFNFSLKMNGLLVLGSSESLGDAEPYFDTIDHRSKIFRSRGNRKSLLSSERFRLPDPSAASADWGNVRKNFRDARGGSDDAHILEALLDTLSTGFIPVSLIVNEDFELIRVTGDSKRYLRPLSGKITTDVTKNLAKDLSVPVATGLAKLFKSRTEVSFSNVSMREDGFSSKVNILIRPMNIRRNAPLLAVIIISETTKPQTVDFPDAIKYDADADVLQRLNDFEQELQFTRESLQATIEELETSNEELQATNEELLASNEELQSTNEELQSVNEELFTVNAEYQGKISELSELNTDMENFMGASRLVALFLDTTLNIRRFTYNARYLFNILEHDVGRPFEHIAHRIKDTDLISLSHQVLETRASIDAEVCAEDGNIYRLRVLPYMLNQDIQGGVMIVLHEITDLTMIRSELLRVHQRKALAQTLTHSATWDWDLSTDCVEWSSNTEPLLGLDDGTLQHSYDAFMQFVHPDDCLELQNLVATALHEGKSYTLQHRIIWPDGSIHLLEQRVAAIFNAQSKPIHLLGMFHSLDHQYGSQLSNLSELS